jgi:hypothetical protein
MAVNNDLFDLIKSLSKSEKRYFRMLSSLNSRGGSNKYMQLFDLIDAQDSYDEQQTRAAFAKKFSARHFSESKYYLYNAILRALHLYDAEGSVDVQIVTALHQAMILYQRNLFRQSEKILARAREQAIENERWHLAVDAQHLEYMIETQKGTPPPQVDDLLSRVFTYNHLWTNREEQWAINARILTHFTAMGRPRNPEQLARLNELLHNDPEQQPTPAESPSATIFRLNSLAVLQQASGDYRGAAGSFSAMLPVLQSSSYWSGDKQCPFTPVLYNICMLSIKARDPETFHRYYHFLIDCTDKSPRSAEYVMYIRTLALQPDLHQMMGEHQEALASSIELEQALARAEEGTIDVTTRAHVMMLLLAIHFGLGDYSRCIEYLNNIFAMKSDGLPTYQFGIARIYQVMIHFERGDDDLLEHLLRSVHRFFVASGNGYKAEKVIITFIKLALRSRNRSEWGGLFQGLLDDILPLADDPFESSFLNWIDLVSWLESKVSHRTYEAVRRERGTMAA